MSVTFMQPGLNEEVLNESVSLHGQTVSTTVTDITT